MLFKTYKSTIQTRPLYLSLSPFILYPNREKYVYISLSRYDKCDECVYFRINDKDITKLITKILKIIFQLNIIKVDLNLILFLFKDLRLKDLYK